MSDPSCGLTEDGHPFIKHANLIYPFIMEFASNWQLNELNDLHEDQMLLGDGIFKLKLYHLESSKCILYCRYQ